MSSLAAKIRNAQGRFSAVKNVAGGAAKNATKGAVIAKSAVNGAAKGTVKNAARRAGVAKAVTSRSEKLMPVACFLLVLLCLFLLAGTLSAKYTTAFSSGTARIATFPLECKGVSASKALVLNRTVQSSTYQFSVSNANDEVATTYYVELTFPSSVPGITAKLTNGSTEISGVPLQERSKFKFNNVGSFMPAVKTTDTLTLTVSVEDATAALGGTWENISLKVIATQVD